jgi:hypothetical protein
MDLHIHTCLSPCADNSMTPPLIVRRAAERGVDCIGITDHNATDNLPAVRRAAEGSGVAVLGGMELTTVEEIHLLLLFDDPAAIAELQRIVDLNLEGRNDEQAIGEQLIVDERGECTGRNRRLLIGATTLPIEQALEVAHGLNGVCIASHVDRPSFSIISQLGFVPEGLALDALEVSPRSPMSPAAARAAGSAGAPSGADNWAATGFPIVRFSDAHFPEDIGRNATSAFLDGPSVEELKNALAGRNGREILR